MRILVRSDSAWSARMFALTGRMLDEEAPRARLADAPSAPATSFHPRPFNIERMAGAVRGHWGVESMHWLLDVEFGDDLSRYRTGHRAKNMAIVRRFALGLVRANKRKGSVKPRRKRAGWDPEFLLEILQLKYPLTWIRCRVECVVSTPAVRVRYHTCPVFCPCER